MFDSHAHVLFSRFDDDREAVIARARAAGLSGWVEVGTDVASSRQAVAFAQKQRVWASVGVHPSDIGSIATSDWKTIEELLAQPRVVAVGEVGFDFHHLPKVDGAPRSSLSEVGLVVERQKEVLKRFVALAVLHNLPVIFHVRDPVSGPSAHEAMIKFLQLLPLNERPRGVMHTFSGNLEQAQRYLELGMYLSFSGVVTFKNAGVTAEVARTVTSDRMLIETDCPFLAPEPFRGARNEPAYVKYVAAKIAELRGVSVAEIEKITDENAQALFRY